MVCHNRRINCDEKEKEKTKNGRQNCERGGEAVFEDFALHKERQGFSSTMAADSVYNNLVTAFSIYVGISAPVFKLCGIAKLYFGDIRAA